MDYNNLQNHPSGPESLPSLMYVDCPPPPPPPPPPQQDIHQPQTKKRPNKVHVSAACVK